MSSPKSPGRKPSYPGSLTNLHRYRKTVHGHDGSSRIVMVRKTDQRTFAFAKNGEEPKLETITRETIETFRGQRTECKITTEKKDCVPEKCPESLLGSLERKKSLKNGIKSSPKYQKNSNMQFQEEFLQAHNEYRQKHGVSTLKLNKHLCEISQNWANFLVKKNYLKHNTHPDCGGENIYSVTSTHVNFTITGDEPVKAWYDEINNHKFGVEPNDLSTGHFTQIVWKETTEIGVGFAKNNGKIVVVANYTPAGNVIGSYARNVPPIGGFEKENNNDYAVRSKQTPSKATRGNFEKDFLEAHNKYRSFHGVPPLKLDRKLCNYSEEWAKILAAKNTLEHRKNNPYGENVFYMYSSDPNFALSGNTPVDKWYEEMKHHPFGKEPSSLKTGHFTQVIWKSSSFLGVGVAQTTKGHIYVVANYSPAGNFVGCYIENVPALILKVNEKNIYDRQENQESFQDFNAFQLEGLKIHNEYRKKHGVAPLILNKQLCATAKEWAQHCANTGTMGHRPNNECGENVFYMYSSDFSALPTAREVVKEWYEEARNYNYDTNTLVYNSLHFTQIIWKDSKELGIAYVKNSMGQTFVVANYNPKGNILGQFQENVLKPRP